MEYTNKPPTGALSEEEEARILAAMERRLRELLASRNADPSFMSKYPPLGRVQFLLFMGTVIAGARSGRYGWEHFASILDDADNGHRQATTPEGRHILRYKVFLGNLVYRGCVRRGEL